MHQQHGDSHRVSCHTVLHGPDSISELTEYRTSNAPDFASRAKTPAAAAIPQLITMPLGFSLVSFIGIVVSSSSQAIYGKAIWSPIDLLAMFLDGHPSSATRFGVWFIAFAFIVAQVCFPPLMHEQILIRSKLGTNISANSISAGCDLTALMPRYIVCFTLAF
jgi:NCS1 family nucleobase:cation symporter-1